MPFTRTHELARLADQIASAMKRGDDIGMDMLRDLLPDLRQTIDEVNLALREVDGLLFEGLRDEAISLHEENFARLVGRLNLEDLENWPVARQFFAAENIPLPPAIDFDTLSALESAHAELEELREPIERLRRLALERGPLERRLAVLRKLRAADPSKPVWAESLAAHEQARLAELKAAVPQALDDRQPERIAELHVELVDPEWTVPVPKDLVRSSRGADAWLQLRGAVGQAEAAVDGLERTHAEGPDGPLPEMIEPLRSLRDQWYEAHRLAEESIAALGHCPVVGPLAREEQLEQRLQGLGARAAAALTWLQGEDAREATAQRFEQTLAALRQLVDHPPAQGAEAAWVADVERHRTEAMQQCQAIPTLCYPEPLADRVEQSLTAVRGRAGGRRLLLVGMVVGSLALAFTLVTLVTQGCATARRRAAAIATLETIVAQARFGSFAAVPAEAAKLERDFAAVPKITDLVGTIRDHAEREARRREAVEQALAGHRQAVQMAEQRLAERTGAACLDEWPAEIVAAAEAYWTARSKGGMAESRTDSGGVAVPATKVPKDCPEALAVLRAEEQAIDECERRQVEIEKKFRLAAGREFAAQLDRFRHELDDMGEPPYSAENVARAKQLGGELVALRRLAEREKTARNDVLLSGSSRQRVTLTESEAAIPLQARIRRIIAAGANGGRGE